MPRKEEINLLAPEVKRARINRLYSIRVDHFFWKVMVGVVFIAAAYTGVWALLRLSLQELVQGVEMNESKGESLERQIRESNDLLLAVRKHRDDYLALTPSVNQLLEVVPSGIEIDRLIMSSEGPFARDTKLVIMGRSSTRSRVLDYQKALDELVWVDSVEAPLQNLASGARVNFSFTILHRADTQPERDLSVEGEV